MRPLAILLAASALAGCGSSSASLEQQPASNTGFMAVAVVGGRTKLYMPAAESPTTTNIQVAVVDPGVADRAEGALRFIDLGPGTAARAIGADRADVVVVDRDTPTVFFIDAATDTVRGSAAFPAGAALMINSNNPGYYSTGVAVDATGRKAYVASSLGLLEYDLDTRAHTGTLVTPATEGFALDAAAGRLYAPYYLCAPNPDDPGTCIPYAQPGGPDLTDSLAVIDVATGVNSSYVDPEATLTWAPLGLDPDSVAIDFRLQLAVVSPEETAALQVLDLAASTFDGAALTCQMPRLTVPMSDNHFTAIAVDSETHLLVAGHEDQNEVAFVDLAKAKLGVVSMLEAAMPDQPDGATWVNQGDPHATTIGVVGDRSYAFLASFDRRFIARIDLAGVKGLLATGGPLAPHVQFIAVAAPP